MLNTDQPMSQINMKDPFVAKSALNQIINLSEVDSLKAEKMASQLFNDISMKYLLDNSDEIFLASLFQDLPAKIFLNSLNTLLYRWPKCSDSVAYWSSPVIARLNSKAANKLFSTYLESDSNPFEDSNKFFGVVESLKYLEEEDSRNISSKLIDSYLDLPEEDRPFFAIPILKLAWELNHPEFNEMLQQFIKTSTKVSERQFMQNFSALSHMFVGSSADYNFVIDYCDGFAKQKYESISLFFKESAPLVDIDNSIESFKKNDFKDVERIFKENLDAESHSRLKDSLEILLNNKDIEDNLDKKKKKFFYSLILGCLITSLRMKKIVLENLPLERVIEMLSADVEEIPSFNIFVKFLKEKNKEEVVRLLIEALDINIKNYGGSHLIDAMGELGYDEFLKPLTHALNEDNDYTFFSAEKALLVYGGKSIDCIKENLESMKDTARASALSVIKKMGGSKAVQFLDEVFEILWREDKEKLLNAIESVPDERFIKRLKPYTNKGQFAIDHTFILLCKLFKQETPEVEALTEKLYQHAMEEQEAREASEQDQMAGGGIKPYFDLTLKCNNCEDRSVYRVKEIIVSHIKDSKPLILDEIKCINCNEVPEFDLAPRSYGMLTEEMNRYQMLSQDKDSMETLKKSPIKFMSIHIKGEEMGLKEGIQATLEDIAKDPDKPENYISVGYLYHNIKKFAKAEEYYKKAVECDPLYIEPYYFIATIAANRNENESAFEWLKNGSRHIGSAKYRQDFEMEKAEFGRIYADLYNDLMRKTGIDEPLLHPGAFSGKAGRNDPCPCGSGKKYKKCCMN